SLPERASVRHCSNESNAHAQTPLTSCTIMHHGCGGRAAPALDPANDANAARTTIDDLFAIITTITSRASPPLVRLRPEAHGANAGQHQRVALELPVGHAGERREQVVVGL